MRALANFLGMVVLPVSMLAVSMVACSGPPLGDPVWQRDPVGTLTQTLGDIQAQSRDRPARSDAQMITAARAVCPHILGKDRLCQTLPVRITDFEGMEAGLARFTEEHVTSGGKVVRSTITATGIDLDESLRSEHPEYLTYVATHEWAHVHQYRLTKTPEKLAALSRRANTYFADLHGVQLTGDAGLEILTDCWAVLGAGASPGPSRRGPTGYVTTYLPGASDMQSACGPGWAQAMPPRD